MRNVGVPLRQYKKMRAGLSGRAFKTIEREHGRQVEASLSKRQLATAEDRRRWEFWNFPRPGPQRVWSCSNPVDYYLSMFSPDLIDLMVTKSNRYVEAEWALELSPNTRLRERRPTEAAEMQVFLAIQISLGLLKKPKISDYSLSKQSVTEFLPCHLP